VIEAVVSQMLAVFVTVDANPLQKRFDPEADID
jgi:hypothetical protein